MTLKDFAKLLDDKLKPIGADISAIEARIRTIEDQSVDREDFLYIRTELKKIEKRLTTVEGQLAKKATKDDLKELATTKQFDKLEKKLDYFFKNLDRDVMTAQKRTDDLEDRVTVTEKQLQVVLD